MRWSKRESDAVERAYKTKGLMAAVRASNGRTEVAVIERARLYRWRLPNLQTKVMKQMVPGEVFTSGDMCVLIFSSVQKTSVAMARLFDKGKLKRIRLGVSYGYYID